MAVPRNRQSNSRKNNKRSHHAKKPVALSTCASCGNWCKTHAACPHCGHYKGRNVLQADATNSAASE